MTPDAIKAARNSLGLSQAQFARVLGVASDRTVRKWEDGEQPPPGPVLVLLRLIFALHPVRKMLGIKEPHHD